MQKSGTNDDLYSISVSFGLDFSLPYRVLNRLVTFEKSFLDGSVLSIDSIHKLVGCYHPRMELWMEHGR
jgi:hypothetical protein